MHQLSVDRRGSNMSTFQLHTHIDRMKCHELHCQQSALKTLFTDLPQLPELLRVFVLGIDCTRAQTAEGDTAVYCDT